MATQRRGEKTRSRILEAAAVGFAEQGYDTTPVAEICQRAGVSKGAFYHHFASKQALFLELLERWLTTLDDRLGQTRTEEAPVPEKLVTMTAMIRRVFQAADEQLPIFLEFWSRAAHDPAIWEATVAPYRRYRAFFADIVRAGVAEGTLRPVDPHTAARVVVSLAVGILVQGLLDAEGADWGDVAHEGMHMLLEGIKKKE
jgi:AcrR family transcriptional regulator